MSRALRAAGRAFAIVSIPILVLLAIGYAGATRAPVVVRYTVRSAAWDALPLTIALLSDTHVVTPDMPPARLARICERVSALRPDIVLLAGDYVSRRMVRGSPIGPAAATASFARCRARVGVWAVLGNHDMRPPVRADDVAAGLRAAGVHVLRNTAKQVGGFWIAGVDDGDYGQADIAAALARVPPGAPTLFLVHNPDRFAEVPARVALTLAGHTHGGQVAPFGWRPVLPIMHRGWARGLVGDHDTRMIVTSGVGASFVPLRIGVPPEIVLVTITGATPSAGSPARRGTARPYRN